MTAAQIRRKLTSAGGRLAKADAARAEALKEIRHLLHDALAAEIPLQEAARLAGISRVTAYRQLDKKD